jgi:hypothetical protein
MLFPIADEVFWAVNINFRCYYTPRAAMAISAVSLAKPGARL